jgi:DNA-binding MarR family transcriptional regulator
MVRKTGRSAKSKRNRKTAKSDRAKKSARRSKNPGRNSAPASVRPPPPGRGKRGEKGYLGYLLRQAQAAARLTLERALNDLGVTPPQFAVLTMLKAYPGLSGAGLARVALLTPQTVGVIIRNLERTGAIKKTPHPVHGRVLQWTLTRRGTALLGKCRRHVRALERRLAAGLTTRSQVTVRRWLSNLATSCSRMASSSGEWPLPPISPCR